MRITLQRKSSLNTLYLVELDDLSRVECVFYRGDTLCVSTQVGCSVGCTFCKSGERGLFRNLTPWEIYKQYEILSKELPIRKIAIAGVGEPLHNFNNVKEAVKLFKRRGLKVSLYTTGFPLKVLREALGLPLSGITLSVHSFKNRRRLNLKGDAYALMEVLREELKKLSKRKRKRVSLAYMPLKGINDTEEEVESFIFYAKELKVSITLLRYNPLVEGLEGIDEGEYRELIRRFKGEGIRVILSTRFRRDRVGGCGSLVASFKLGNSQKEGREEEVG